jgi:hypothetical protein
MTISVTTTSNQATLDPMSTGALVTAKHMSQSLCDTLVTDFIANSLSPVSIVENEQFKSLVEIGRAVVLGGRKYYTRKIGTRFATMIDTVKRVSASTCKSTLSN